MNMLDMPTHDNEMKILGSDTHSISIYMVLLHQLAKAVTFGIIWMFYYLSSASHIETFCIPLCLSIVGMVSFVNKSLS